MRRIFQNKPLRGVLSVLTRKSKQICPSLASLDNKKFFFALILVVMLGGLCLAVTARAQTIQPSDLGLQPVGQNLGLPSTDIRTVVANIIRVFLGLLGIIAVVLIIYAGYLWMTAGGNEEQIASAKKVLTNAVIGLIIILSAYAITSFVISKLVEATTGGLPSHCSDGALNEDESGTDCGGSCNPCVSDPDPFGVIGDSFYVLTLPKGGQMCIANVSLVVVFNRPVDIQTLQGNIIIKKELDNPDNTEVPVDWVRDESNKSLVYFKPKGDCKDGIGKDCLLPKTGYVLEFKNCTTLNCDSIKSGDGSNLTLSCNKGAGCKQVKFTTGEKIDITPPKITINSPDNNSILGLGDKIPVDISWEDDNGVQNILLSTGGKIIGSQSISGCQKTGAKTILWPTNKLTIGNYTLDALGMDWATLSGKASVKVELKALHCFDEEKNYNETSTDCGGSCGACAGDKCSQNEQCASGFCLIEDKQTEGYCAEKTKITGVSPMSGAVGTYVSISGKYFREDGGNVYFAKIEQANKDNINEWVEAPVVSCGDKVDNWKNYQVIVSVPVGAAVGPIMIKTQSYTDPKGHTLQFTDLTNDNWGTKFPNFAVNNKTGPGVCGVIPDKGAPGISVTILGKDFGVVSDKVSFGQLNAKITFWGDNAINTFVPNLDNGEVAVKVYKQDIPSNGVKFKVEGKNDTAPFITSISPESGAQGEYITILGKNFGKNIGQVWFKFNGVEQAINGNFDFPLDCKNSVWNDTEIKVKFPSDDTYKKGKYLLQVVNSEGVASPFVGPNFVLQEGQPSPGICKIDPLSGPVPFAEGMFMKISGEYFENASDVYFWQTGADAKNITGRMQGEQFKLENKNLITVRPPKGVQTGPVVVYRPTDKKISNPINYTVSDCVSSGCLSGTRCCLSGIEKGSCKKDGDLCIGETVSTAYIWRFCTKDIPQIPKVVERCDGETDPTPSPNLALWKIQNTNDDQENVCRTALSIVEFNMFLDENTVNEKTVLVRKCTKIEDNNCSGEKSDVILDKSSFVLNSAAGDKNKTSHYVAIKPATAGGKWDDNSYYQVVLLKTIKALSKSKTPAYLQVTKPCTTDKNSAYCFVFKTDAQECKLDKVVVMPYKYWTNILEKPIKYYVGVDTYDVFYKGLGLSSQHCIAMSTDDYNWKWSAPDVQNVKYAEIFDNKDDKPTAQVSSISNTVAIGLTKPDDAVNISAAASKPGVDPKTGYSPLTIDLANPQVVDNWPNCLEACTDAAIGVKFNISMSMKNMSNGQSVKMYECINAQGSDENCISKVAVPIKYEFAPNEKNYTISVQPLDDKGNKVFDLKKDAIYQVEVSSEIANSLSQLWSLATLSKDPNDISNFSKPYAKKFTWRFKTKKEACKIDRVEVLPKVFTAYKNTDRAVYAVQPYSAPDKCSSIGQKLNPWKSNWGWSSQAPLVAEVKSFTTKGFNPYCTTNCLKKGSDIPSGDGEVFEKFPVCGNGAVEAGEDCDIAAANETAQSCTLTCLRKGNADKTTCGDGKAEPLTNPLLGEACDPKDPKTQIGCSDTCRHTGSQQKTASTDVNASICGNGMVGSGEDCDIGQEGGYQEIQSGLLCSQTCLHTGTRLSKAWCAEQNTKADKYVGYGEATFNFYCQQAYSQCGDGVASPDEDVGCEKKGKGDYDKTNCNEKCLLKKSGQCENANTEGCGSEDVLLGSSLLYTTPSVCGDGNPGIGEDPACENVNQIKIFNQKSYYNPWSLAKGVGKGKAEGDPLAQVTFINAKVTDGPSGIGLSGKGKFEIPCGYMADSECPGNADNKYGVGADTCCYARPKLISTYPRNDVYGVCINTFIAAEFDSVMDSSSSTLSGNIIIARGTPSDKCPANSNDVTDLVKTNITQNPTWFKKILNKILDFVFNIFGGEAKALVGANRWCSGLDLGAAKVVPLPDDKGSKLLVILKQALQPSTDYAIILKEGIKDVKGVSIGKPNDGKNISWHFVTGEGICELTSVQVTPSQYYFSKANKFVPLLALPQTANGQFIQSVAGYKWDWVWGPANNPYVLWPETKDDFIIATAQNKNGEIDIRASANLYENKYTSNTGLVATGKSHIIIFLCENPWPPKEVNLAGDAEPKVIFPYEDKVGNNDNYDLDTGVWNSQLIPAAESGGYFNFSSYYCADNGESGMDDDLPYLRPAVQTKKGIFSAEAVEEAVGKCEKINIDCASDADCGYDQITLLGYTFYKTKGGICISSDANGSFGYFFGTNGQPLVCDKVNDCNSPEYNTWTGSRIKGCQPVSMTAPALKCIKNMVEVVDNQKVTPFKRFILTNNKNYDAIGIQIFANPYHLSAKEWVGRNFPGFTGQLQDLNQGVDGYDAVTDGNNIYINALNFSSKTGAPSSGNLYTNIYLFSINGNAQPETRKVFDALLGNLKFNVNLTNYGYCGSSIDSPDNQILCANDLDCSASKICSVQISKLKRNYQRLQDINTIENLLESYYAQAKTYPPLSEGTYLTGQTISTWPSWSVLATQLKIAIPTDPINKLSQGGTCSVFKPTSQYCLADSNCIAGQTCILHDPITNWSTADQRYSFACNSNSYAYRYIFSKDKGFDFKIKFEDTGLTVKNEVSLIFDFIGNTKHFKEVRNFNGYGPDDPGICLASNEISSMQTGYCGDGKINWDKNLNKNEECDPPGKVEYDKAGCKIGLENGVAIAGTMDKKTCNSSCQWETQSGLSCVNIKNCGNGKSDPGEVCDDGVLNGKYGHCASGCKGYGSDCGDGQIQTPDEICDTAQDYVGWCANGANAGFKCTSNGDCNAGCIDTLGFPRPILDTSLCNSADSRVISYGAQCATLKTYGVKYGATGEKETSKTSSCNFDCQSYGPYCGDGIVQKEFGEECDGNETCSVGGVGGTIKCSSACRLINSQSAMWLTFNNRIELQTNSDPFSIGDYQIIGAAYLNSAKGSYSVKCEQGKCPLIVEGKSGKAAEFNGSSYLKIIHDTPFNVNELTIAMWIKTPADFTGYGDAYLPIIIKQSSADKLAERDYNFYAHVIGGRVKELHLYSWNRLGISSWPVNFGPNEWHHIAVTVDANRNHFYYVDGVYAKASPADISIATPANRQYDILIGKDEKIYFKGTIDDLYIYGKALAPDEILFLMNNSYACEPSVDLAKAQAKAMAGGCGDGKVDSGEACDSGAGKNGIACKSGYNKSCSYCSADCKNVLHKEASGFCGDGIVNGPEACDTDTDGTIFSVTSTAGTFTDKFSKDGIYLGYKVKKCSEEWNTKINFSGCIPNNTPANCITHKKGDKKCVNNCMSLTESCVECGISETGAQISGNIINVLEPQTNLSTLYTDATKWTIANIDLYFDDLLPSKSENNKVAYRVFYNPDVSRTYTLYPAPESAAVTVPALVNPDPICSATTSTGERYQLVLNDDRQSKHILNWPVVNNATPGLYDLILSPIIRKVKYSKSGDTTVIDARPKDLRIVVSWIGDVELYSGFIIPSAINPTYEETELILSNGIKYFSTPANPNLGIWYHGLSEILSSKIKVKAYTIDTSKITLANYGFYVRSAPNTAIQNYYSAKVKVDVYEPEDETIVGDESWRHFSKPVKTFYLSGALPTKNPSANYWHVFNIIQSTDASAVTAAANLDTDSNKGLNSIRSQLQMSYKYNQ